MTVRILHGDCRELLRQLADESAHCVVTSPPYWALRDYKVGGQLGLEPSPDEYITAMVAVFREVRRVLRDDGTLWLNMGDSYAGSRAGGGTGSTLIGSRNNQNEAKDAKRMVRSFRRDQEPVPRSDVIVSGLKAKDMVGMPWRLAFALQADGWWLRQDIVWAKPNPMPESVTDRCTKSHEFIFLLTKSETYFYDAEAIAEPVSPVSIARVMQPTFDDQAGGPKDYGTNGTNRSRSMRKTVENFADQVRKALPENQSHLGYHRDAARAEVKRSGNVERKYREDFGGAPHELHGGNQGHSVPWEGVTRNKRDVWTVTAKPFAEAHFATFPPDLIEPCVLAGTSERGCCPQCLAPWQRVLQPSERYAKYRCGSWLAGEPREVADERGMMSLRGAGNDRKNEMLKELPGKEMVTEGWRPICEHYPRAMEWAEFPRFADPSTPEEEAAQAVELERIGKLRAELLKGWEGAATAPAVVLDPFGGAGTTGLVADRHHRDAVLVELNPEYVEIARRRIVGDSPLFAQVTA